MNWQDLAAIFAVVATIIGGWWAVEARFERKLNIKIESVRIEIESVHKLIIDYIVKKQ